MIRASDPGDRVQGRTAVVYLARGEGTDHVGKFQRFLSAYQAVPAGLDHQLIVIFKGFADDAGLEAGRAAFKGVGIEEIHTSDDSFDLGAYAEAVLQVDADRICFLNTNSEPVCANWLLKLALILERPGVGLVGATGSYEAHLGLDPRFPTFPSIHLRTNAFMMTGELAREVVGGLKINSKLDAYLAESGETSITRQVTMRGFQTFVVGRNGRGYGPTRWGSSGTFRQGRQENLLVHDNATRSFEELPWVDKKRVHDATWGSTSTQADFLIEDFA